MATDAERAMALTANVMDLRNQFKGLNAYVVVREENRGRGRYGQ